MIWHASWQTNSRQEIKGLKWTLTVDFIDAKMEENDKLTSPGKFIVR